MGNNRKIVTGKEPCIRCGDDIDNEFRKQPWCFECGIELQGMSFTGEDMLEAVLSTMPPLHLKFVEVVQVHRIARKMLIHQGIFPAPEDDENDDDTNTRKSLILT